MKNKITTVFLSVIMFLGLMVPMLSPLKANADSKEESEKERNKKAEEIARETNKKIAELNRENDKKNNEKNNSNTNNNVGGGHENDSDDDDDEEEYEDDDEYGDDDDDHGGNNPPPIFGVPIISAIGVSGIGTTTANINWNTDLFSDSSVLYGTILPISLPNSTTTSSASLVKNHSLVLLGLNPNTVYYFRLSSVANGKTGVSEVYSFKTLALAEPVILPNILYADSFKLSSSTASVISITDQPSSGKLWLSTTTPVVTTGSPTLSFTTPSYFHLFPFSGLATSTTYYYVISASNVSGGTATSSTLSFTTLAI